MGRRGSKGERRYNWTMGEEQGGGSVVKCFLPSLTTESDHRIPYGGRPLAPVYHPLTTHVKRVVGVNRISLHCMYDNIIRE